MNQRGQTAYDYLLGVTLLLVAIITVLSLFPQVFGPFVEPTSSAKERMADRVASDIIEANAVGDNARTLNTSRLNDDDYIEQVKGSAGLKDLRGVNVSVRAGSATLAQAGDERIGNQPSATVVRTVRTVDGQCESGCQLVVRVW